MPTESEFVSKLSENQKLLFEEIKSIVKGIKDELSLLSINMYFTDSVDSLDCRISLNDNVIFWFYKLNKNDGFKIYFKPKARDFIINRLDTITDSTDASCQSVANIASTTCLEQLKRAIRDSLKYVQINQ